MLYKVLSPDSLYDQSSNDSGIDDCFRGSNRSPLPGEVQTPPGDCSQQSPSTPTSAITEFCNRGNKTTTETANETLTGAKNRINTELQKKYLGVRVRQPVRDLLRSYRIAKGEDPKAIQEDMTWKSSNVRRRVVRDVVHGHPYAAGRARQIKKPIAYLPKNFEELLEDLVEVLETDLKQGKMCSDQTVQGPVEMDCQAGCYIGCPVSLWGSHYSSQHPMLQTDQGALHSYQSYFSKDGATRPDLESASPEPYSHSESESWDLSPVHLLAFADEHCGNTSDRAFNCHPCYSQNIMEQSFPRSPSPEAKRFSQAALNIIQSSKSSHIDSKDHPVSPQQQLLPDNSAMSFFQFQLRHVEWSLSTMSTQEILSVDKNGNLMLHNAVIQGKRALAYSLACRMANMGRIDAKDTRGRTALHLAAERNQHLMVNDLISLGAQINYKDYLGKTPVHLCAENGFLRVLQAIEKTLMNGTDVDIDAMDNNYLTPLHCAVLAHSATVKEFENSDLDGNMEKFLTLRKDQLLDGMKCLLRMGASLSRQDMNGRSAIHFAVEESDTEVLNFLYSHVGKIKTDLHKEFGSFAVLGVMDQKADLQVVVPELLPCDIPSRPAMRCEELGLRLSIGCQ